MKGATAEPLVNTTSPPNTTIMIMIGSSQNFLRTRMKRQSSARKSITSLSELVLHCLRRRSRRLPRQPIAVATRLTPQAQQVPPHSPHDETGRQHRSVEHQTHDNGI